MIFRFGSYTLHEELLELRLDGQLVDTEPQVFRLIAHLIRKRDQVVSKDELIAEIWDGRIVSDAALNSRINLARKAIGDTGRSQSVIKTFPRRGFRFVAETNEAGDNARAAAATTPIADQNKPSIAVLPFKNLSDDPEQQYFSDGMTEDLITDLSKISGLFVVARNSSFSFKEQSVEVREIGEQLGVKNILEGSVRKIGSKLRINAQLIDAANGGHLWAERYDGEIGDIFDFQDSIWRKIIAALQVKLTPFDKVPAERRPSANIEAHDLFLRGRASYFKYTLEDYATAKRYLEQAIALDPEFADAYSFLSYVYAAAWNLMYPGLEDGLERALQMAEKAISLDPNSAIAHMRLGWTLCFMRQFDRARSCFEKAMVLGPGIAEICFYYSVFLNYTGRPEQALEMIDKAYRLEPIVPTFWDLQVGYAHWELQHYDEAVVQFRKIIDRVPGFTMTYMFLASVYVELGRLDDATAQLRALRAMNPAWSVRHADRIFPILSDDTRKRFLDNLRQAGLPE